MNVGANWKRSCRSLFLLLVSGLLLAAQPRFDAARVDALAEAERQRLNAPGMALVLLDGENSYLKGYGVRRLGGDDPVTAETLFAVGSVTKSLTALGAAVLVDDGKLEWDRPVREYIPWFRLDDPVASDLATVRDLLTHRVGLPRWDFIRYAVPLAREELVRRMRYLPPTATFRERYQYQNLAYTAAGYLTGYLDGRAWEEFIGRRVLDPLKMSASALRVSEVRKRANFASPHEVEGGRLQPVEYYDYQRFGVGPNGALNTTAADMAKYLRFHMGDGTVDGKRVLAPRTLAELHRPQMVVDDATTYALGWNVSWPDGARLVYHGGSITGFRAWAGFVPERKEGIAVLMNCSCNVDSVARSIANEVLGWKLRAPVLPDRLLLRSQEPPPAAGPPSRPLEAYTGRYEHPAFGVAEVVLEGGRLAVRFPALTLGLEHIRFDIFRHAGRGIDAQFLMDARGDFTELRLRLEPLAPPVPFRRAR